MVDEVVRLCLFWRLYGSFGNRTALLGLIVLFFSSYTALCRALTVH